MEQHVIKAYLTLDLLPLLDTFGLLPLNHLGYEVHVLEYLVLLHLFFELALARVDLFRARLEFFQFALKSHQSFLAGVQTLRAVALRCVQRLVLVSL